MIRRSTLLAALAMIVSPVAGLAQDRTADVLSPGEARFTVGGTYLGFRSLFDGNGNPPLGSELDAPITPADLPVLDELGTSVSAFLAATDTVPFPVEAGDLFAGELMVRFGWNTRFVPVRIGVGVLPRVEVGVGMSAYRNERFPRRFGLVGGAVGLNPDPSGNAALLAGMDPTGTSLGNSPVLPVEGTRLGAELQERVFEATGDSLSLPLRSVVGPEFEEAFGFDPFPSAVGIWRRGDLEVDARFEVVRTFEAGHYPTPESDVDLRVVVEGALRFATGDMGAENPRLDWGPQVGFGARRVGAAADLFGGRFLWLSGGASYTWIGSATVRVATSSEPIPGDETVVVEARREPGGELDLWLTPRVRLTDELSIGATLRAERWGEGVEEVAAVRTPIPSSTRRSLGLVFRYTNLPAYDEGRTRIPIETAIGFNVAVAGTGGAPVSRTGFVQVSLVPRFWGARPRSPE